MNQAELIARVESALNRTDISSEIPSFVERVEEVVRARLARDPIRPMGASASSDLLAGETDAALPDDFVDVIDLIASDGDETWQMVRLDPSDAAGFYGSRALPYATAYNTAKDRHYFILGSTISLPDAAQADLSLTLRYYQRLPALASGENWLSASHAVVYELGVLAFANKKLKDVEETQRNMDLFLGALDDVIASYPERQSPTELRSDLPVNRPWSILNG